MNYDRIYDIGWGIACITLVGSSLLSRRLAWGQVLRNIIAWALIFTLVYGVILFRDQWQPLWDRAKADLGGAPLVSVDGATTILTMQEDGHFHAMATINGQQIDFLIDSGATKSALSAATAAKLRLRVDRSGFPAVVSTANGMIESWPAELPTMTVGAITTQRLEVLVGGGANDGIDVLGMNWLSQLRSWRVEGRQMTLTP